MEVLNIICRILFYLPILSDFINLGRIVDFYFVSFGICLQDVESKKMFCNLKSTFLYCNARLNCSHGFHVKFHYLKLRS